MSITPTITYSPVAALRWTFPLKGPLKPLNVPHLPLGRVGPVLDLRPQLRFDPDASGAIRFAKACVLRTRGSSRLRSSCPQGWDGWFSQIPAPTSAPVTGLDEWYSQNRAAVSRISFEIPFHFRRGQPQCPHQRCLPIEHARTGGEDRRRTPTARFLVNLVRCEFGIAIGRGDLNYSRMRICLSIRAFAASARPASRSPRVRPMSLSSRSSRRRR
jgi:hypothetical protein